MRVLNQNIQKTLLVFKIVIFIEFVQNVILLLFLVLFLLRLVLLLVRSLQDFSDVALTKNLSVSYKLLTVNACHLPMMKRILMLVKLALNGTELQVAFG